MTTHLRWVVIGLVFLATLINFIDRLTISVLAPIIVEDLKLSQQQFGQMATWFLVAYSASQALSGRLYDYLGIRRGFTVSVCVWSLAAMGHAAARSAAALSAFRFVLGLGEAGNWPGAAKVVTKWFPIHERAFAMAIFNSGAALGSVVAPPLIIFLQLTYGWQATFLVTGALGFLWLAAWLAIYPRDAPARGPNPSATRVPIAYAQILRDRRVWAIILSRFLTDPVWWLYITWLPLYFYRVHGLDLKQIAWFASVPYLAADAGSLLGGAASGWLIRRGGSWTVERSRRAVILVSAGLMSLGFIAALLTNPIAATALISCVLFGFQAWINNVQTMPGDFFPESTVASVAGLGGLGAGIGAMIFTLTTGWVADHFGYQPILLTAGLLPIAGTTILLALLRNAPASHAPQPAI